jgi:alpha-galactosidase
MMYNTLVANVPPSLTWQMESGFGLEFLEVEAHDHEGTVVPLAVEVEWVASSSEVRGGFSVSNAGAFAISLREICIKFVLKAAPLVDRIFVQSPAMTGNVGLRASGCEQESAGLMGWTDRCGTAAALAGFLDHADAATHFVSSPWGGGCWEFAAIINREGLDLEPGATLFLPSFVVFAGQKLSVLLQDYADEVSFLMGARISKPPESGWCSWYHFYGKETFEDVEASAAELAGLPLAQTLRTIQIDDGWNREPSGNLPDAWGDWERHAEKFPGGMAGAAQCIHDLGFRAGLWLAPFAVARNSHFFREHPDWLLQQRDPQSGDLSPAPGSDNPEIFSLDCTHPGALAWLRFTFRRVFSEWNFDYVKIDFLHHGARQGVVRHDAAATSVEAYRRGLQAINDEAGEGKFILACGAPLLPSVGLVDGMRVGPDVGGRWLFDPGWPDWPLGNCCVRAAGLTSIWSQWMHGRLWQNDPDCLLARRETTEHERNAMERLEAETALTNPDYIATPLGLTAEEAGLWTRLVWMGGGMALLSEVWSNLPVDRQALLARCFPSHGRETRLLDWYESNDVLVLLAEGLPLLVGLFNFGDSTVRPVIPACELGLRDGWNLTERWNGEVFTGGGETVVFPEIPPHAGRIWETSL